jgi:hypothetical protein
MGKSSVENPGELARELNLTNKALLEKLTSLNIMAGMEFRTTMRVPGQRRAKRSASRKARQGHRHPSPQR